MRLFRPSKRPPRPSDVAKRAQVLAHLVGSYAAYPPPEIVASSRAEWSPSEWHKFRDELGLLSKSIVESLKERGLWSSVSRSERVLFETNPVDIVEQQITNISWRNEALNALLWSLGLKAQMGPIYEEAELNSTVPVCLKGIDERTATLRPMSELQSQRDIVQLWHWRSRTRTLQEQSHDFQLERGISIEDVIRVTAESMVADGALPAVVSGDFPVLGKAYRDLTADEWSHITSITTERHFALNWVCGEAPNNEWDETPTDT